MGLSQWVFLSPESRPFNFCSRFDLAIYFGLCGSSSRIFFLSLLVGSRDTRVGVYFWAGLSFVGIGSGWAIMDNPGLFLERKDAIPVLGCTL